MHIVPASVYTAVVATAPAFIAGQTVSRVFTFAIDGPLKFVLRYTMFVWLLQSKETRF